MSKVRELKIGIAEDIPPKRKSKSTHSHKNKELRIKKEGLGFENEAAEEESSTRNVSTLFGIREIEGRSKNSRKSKINRKEKSKKHSKRNKILVILVLVFIGLGAFAYQKFYIPYKNIRASVDNIQASFKNIIQDFEDKDLTNLDQNINNVRSEFNLIKGELENFKFLETLGPTKGYYENLEIIINVVDKTDLLLEEALPELKEVLAHTGFKVAGVVGDATTGTPTPVETEEGVISLILGDMPRYIAFYEGLEPSILGIYDEVLKLNPKYIPSVGSYDVPAILANVRTARSTFPAQADQILAFLEKVPALTGSAGAPARYLIIMQNENELRSSGGIYTVYGSMVLENGELTGDITLKDLWKLENYVRGLGINTGPLDFNPYEEYPDYVSPFGYYQNIYGQARLMNEGCGATSMRAQDAGLYPDLKWDADIFQDYYYWASYYNPEEYPPYDHVVVMNQAFIANILSLVAPIELEGYGEITADNFIDTIKQETDRPDLVMDPDRKQIIDDLADLIQEKFYKLDSDQLPVLGQILINSIYARDLALSSTDPDLQNFLDRYNLSGEFEQEFAGDYFHLGEAQNCSLKINRWMRNEVQHNITINDDGSIHRDVYVLWTQPQVFKSEYGYMYSATTQYSYRAWVRLFTPVGSNGFDSDGYVKSGYLYYLPHDYYDETMNKQMYDMIVQFDHRRLTEDDPVAQHDVTVSYELPDILNYNNLGEYRLLIQKHPGKSWGERHVIHINYRGQKYSTELILSQDKIVSFKGGQISVTDYQNDLDWLTDIIQDISL